MVALVPAKFNSRLGSDSFKWCFFSPPPKKQLEREAGRVEERGVPFQPVLHPPQKLFMCLNLVISLGIE